MVSPHGPPFSKIAESTSGGIDGTLIWEPGGKSAAVFPVYAGLQIGTVIQRHIEQKGKSFLLGTICMFYRNVSLATCTCRFISG